LKLKPFWPFWWLVEFFHHGRGREIPMGNEGNTVKVHRSVKTRMEARYGNGCKYSPKANIKFEEGRVKWVD
jgi:hypothetical protein